MAMDHFVEPGGNGWEWEVFPLFFPILLKVFTAFWPIFILSLRAFILEAICKI
jgi:hypothetical protein